MPVAPVELPPGVNSQQAKRESIAILPFTNRSSNPENEYLCDGNIDYIGIRLI